MTSIGCTTLGVPRSFRHVVINAVWFCGTHAGFAGQHVRVVMIELGDHAGESLFVADRLPLAVDGAACRIANAATGFTLQPESVDLKQLPGQDLLIRVEGDLLLCRTPERPPRHKVSYEVPASWRISLGRQLEAPVYPIPPKATKSVVWSLEDIDARDSLPSDLPPEVKEVVMKSLEWQALPESTKKAKAR